MDDAARKALAESEERYRRLVEQGPVGIYVHDGQRLLFANREVARMLGAASPAELVGTTLDKIVHPDDLEAVRKRVHALKDNPEFNPVVAGQLVRKDGLPVHVQVTANKCLFEGKPAVQVVLTDITERHQAEVALRQREAVLRAIFDTVEGGITVVSVEGPRSFRVEDVNPFILRWVGVTSEQLVGQLVDGARTPANTQVVDMLERVVRDVKSATLEVETRYSSAWAMISASPIKDADGAVRHVLMVMVPIDSRKKMERELEASRERYRALVEGHPDAILRVRKDGRVIGAHVPKEMGIAWTAPEPYLEDVLPIEVVRGVLPLLGAALSGGAPQRLETSLAGPRSLELRVVRSGVDEVTILVRDTSDVSLMQKRLAASERMASLGTLSAGVAHEINNPLAFVVGNHEVALAALDKALTKLRAGDVTAGVELEKAEEALRDAAEGARRVQHTVRDLKTFSRADEKSGGLVDVKSVVSSTLHLAENSIRHRARLETQLPDVPPVYGNASRLGQVVLNLVVNAVDALGETSKEMVIRVALRSEQGKVVLEVHDTGSGIPDDVLPHIFEPFYTTKGVGLGTGLGLSICHGIVTAMGGDIRVVTSVGEGTTFTVSLPAASEALESTALEPEEKRSHRRARILVIDDEPLVGKLVQRLLEDHHDVSVSQSGDDAVARIKRGESYDLLFCDLMMPDVTGMELHEKLSREHPDLARRMIFMTGGAFTTAASDFLERVAAFRLEKPFSAADVESAVRRALDGLTR